MDTVIGLQHDRKRLLTLFFRKNHIILIFLLPDGKASSVARIFNWLESKLGLDVFRRLFYAILTDNGSEFQRVEELEVSPENKYRTNIYFCEPMNPSQKGAIEKAHVEIRKILPKKTSFQNLEQKDLILIMNHVNSYLRKDLGFKCPYDLVREDDHDMLKLMKVMHLEKIHPDQVKLLPSLLNK